jgi:LPS-assembly protein
VARLIARALVTIAIVVATAAHAQAQVATPVQPPAAPAPVPADARGNCVLCDAEEIEMIGENHVQFRRKAFYDLGGGTRVSAELIDFYLKESRLVASGNVVFDGPEGLVTAESAEFDVLAGRGTFRNAWGFMSLGTAADPTQFVAGQSPDMFFWGESIERVGTAEYQIKRGGFTTCVQPTPRWDVATSDLVLKINDYAIARHMVLRVKNVPVMYLPFLYYPIQDDERATGFLMPAFGTSTVRGRSLSNAFFWAISRSHDATFFHDWFTRTGQGVGSEYRYVTGPGSFGTFRFFRLSQNETTFTRDNGTTALLPQETSYEVDVSVNQRLRNNLRAQATVDYFSSLVTRQLYHQTVEQATNRNRVISAGLSGSFGPLSTGVYYLRTETFNDGENWTEYGNTPRVTANLAPQSIFGTRMYASVNSEYAFLPYRQFREGELDPRDDRSLARFELAPMLRAPLSQLTFLSVNTTASYRSTYYSKSESTETPGVLVPESVLRNYLALRSDIIGPVLTKIWDTPDSMGTERMKHVIEPTFAVDYVSEFKNEAAVPKLTDTSDFVVAGAMRLTYGITNRLFARARSTDGRRGSTREFVTLGIQQTYYSDPRASRFDSTYVTYSGRRDEVDLSPIAVIGRFSPSNVIDANGRIEYDVSGNGLQSVSIGSAVNGVRGSGSVTYSRTRYSPNEDSSSYVSGSARVNSGNNRLSGNYALSWDISNGYIVSQTVMLSYLAQCCGLTAEFQKYNFAESSGLPVPSDVRFNFGFTLSGLGTFSNFFGAFGGAY